jgi:hypothetical protein
MGFVRLGAVELPNARQAIVSWRPRTVPRCTGAAT